MPDYWVRCTSEIIVTANDDEDAKIKFMEVVREYDTGELEFEVNQVPNNHSYKCTNCDKIVTIYMSDNFVPTICDDCGGTLRQIKNGVI